MTTGGDHSLERRKVQSLGASGSHVGNPELESACCGHKGQGEEWEMHLEKKGVKTGLKGSGFCLGCSQSCLPHCLVLCFGARYSSAPHL